MYLSVTFSKPYYGNNIDLLQEYIDLLQNNDLLEKYWLIAMILTYCKDIDLLQQYWLIARISVLNFQKTNQKLCWTTQCHVAAVKIWAHFLLIIKQQSIIKGISVLSRSSHPE